MRNRNWMFGISAGAALASTAMVACGSDDNVTNVYETDGGVTGVGTVTLPDGAVIGKILIDSITTAGNTACPAGGTTIEIGNDANGNGVLDPSEITSTQEVCSKAQILTTTTPTGADDMCAYGGTIVQSGADTNGDGILQPGEVMNTQEICGGGFGATLTTTTALPVGSTQCPLGGVETKTGLDNGAGGGVAGDGILQPGEVTSTTDTCTTATGYDVGSFAPPAAVANQPAFTVTTNGGTGLTGQGGNSGGISIEKGGTLGGHLKVFKTGLADASFALPTYTPSYGATKLDVTTNTTLSTTAPTVFPAYYVTNSTLVYATAAGVSTIVTGIHVAAGATLTLPSTVNLAQLENDIVVEGTLAAPITAATGVAASIILRTSGAFVGASTGTLTAAGATGTNVNSAGGSGGEIQIYATFIINQAAFDTSGGAAAALNANGTASNGGAAGSILLTTDGESFFGDDDDDDDDDVRTVGSVRKVKPQLQPAATVGAGVLYNTGALKANGGAGAGAGTGGSGATVILRSAQGGLYNSGAITTIGAAGVANGAAGSGGSVDLNLDFGNGTIGLYNSGTITTSGGSASTTCTVTSCTGGFAGSIDLASSSGTLVTSGTLTAVGGSAINGAAGIAPGGSGGSIGIDLSQNETDFGNNNVFGGFVYAPMGNVLVSGNLATNGGNGTIGGYSGNVDIELDTPRNGTGQEVQLLGYTDFFASGGDGVTNGGSSATVRMQNGESESDTSNEGAGTGAVINYANITARGGNAKTSGGGFNGGLISLSSTPENSLANNVQFVQNFGTLDASGGNGFSTGGTSGYVLLLGADGIQNSGAITIRGGNAAGVGGTAGSVGSDDSGVSFSTGGIILNSGAIALTGGNGTGATSFGGSCNDPLVFSAQSAITNSGALSCVGGNSTGEVGGNGGQITISSRTNQYTGTGTTYAVIGGTGTTTGAAGTVTLDGIVQ